MPHKRAKSSARHSQRDALGFDRAPAGKSGLDDIPRSARHLFSAPPPKRKAEADAASQETPALKIRPNERMRDFNQRVENAFATDINSTMRREQRSESNTRKRERRRELLNHFGGLQELSRASAEEIAKAPGISKKLAELIYDTLHSE